MLRTVVGFARRTKKSVVWSFFWCMYFHFAIRRSRMIQNYLAAWRTKYPDYYLVIFVDNEGYTKLPCPDPESPTTDDKFLVSYLESFYRISQIERGLIRALLPKNRVRLDVVDLSCLRCSTNSGAPCSHWPVATRRHGWAAQIDFGPGISPVSTNTIL